MARDLYRLYHFTKQMHHDVYPSISPSNPALSVAGRTVLVSGGGSGVGLATAKYYAQAGAAGVVITGRRVEYLEDAKTEIMKESPKTQVTLFSADIGNKDSVAALWKHVADKGVKIDVLNNNAGRGGEHKKIGEGDVDEWWSIQVLSPSL
jgi:NADP-dependent 3-hydroxy acid dehydrogenase YdfG